MDEVDALAVVVRWRKARKDTAGIDRTTVVAGRRGSRTVLGGIREDRIAAVAAEAVVEPSLAAVRSRWESSDDDEGRGSEMEEALANLEFGRRDR